MSTHPNGDDSRTRIVGLGASAGGLAPLEEFISHVPAHSGFAYIVVQHLDPMHKTMLPEILQRATSLPVREVTAPICVDPNVVYVIAPNTELTVRDGHINVAVPSKPQGRRLPIDVLFCSMARDLAERSIGVVFSGMGADGTLGLQAIKAQGGLTAAQDPEEVQFDSMPRSAIASGAVDIVAHAAELPQRILAITIELNGAESGARVGQDAAGAQLSGIMEVLHTYSKHDLSLYKPGTMRRRIDRRMAIHGIKTTADYAAYLQANSSEVALLFKEVLIGVTSFFRDPDAWKELETVVLPQMLARGKPGTQFRAWVAGCSTGEEAYSLAMAFCEALGRIADPNAFTLQIFATDLNADAIEAARRGRFPAESVAALSADRVRNFFKPQQDGYIVSPHLRDMVLFSQHDVIMDPPFTRLDLLCCRNLLIYFGAALQSRLLPVFRYCLRPSGILFLGGSETIGPSRDLFTPLSSTSRFYRRSTGAVIAVNFPAAQRRNPYAPLQPPDTVRRPAAGPNLQALADQLMLQKYAPPALLVNELGDVLYISGHTGRYLEPAAGKANWNIHAMARPGIRTQLAVALRRAIKERTTVEARGLPIDDNPNHRLDIVVEAIEQPKALQGLLIIVFSEAAAPPAGKTEGGDHGSGNDRGGGADLVHSQEEITALRETMRAAEEERHFAIEQLESTNEELQSANEELTTSKEECQSINEELQTINAELQSKLDDLALAQSDMQNLLNSTDIATLFLDKKLNVRRFTEQIKGIFSIRDSDVGRPLSDLATTLIYPELHADVQKTLQTLVSSDREISATDAHWYRIRIMPYRTVSDVIQGVVMTIIDITAAKALESRLRMA